MGPDLRFAHELADAADAITMARFRAADLHVETKPDLTPVSEADRAAEEAIRALVASRRGGEGVLGEELGDDGTPQRWIVDPIDGTRNYVRGVPVWGTLLALEREGRIEVGSSRPLRSAGAGGRAPARAPGRTANGAGCPASAVSRTASSRPPPRRRCRRRGRPSRRPPGRAAASGDFWQHCLVAEGAVDVAADEELSLWDYAAVQILVDEAGGRCSTFTGGPPAPGNPFLATNGAVHDAALALLAPLASGARGCADRLLVDRGRGAKRSSSALSRSLGEAAGSTRRRELLAAEPHAELARPARSGRIARSSRACSQPAQQRRLGRGPADADLLLADPRPAARELDPPVVRPRPGDVRDAPCGRRRRASSP